MRNIFKDIISLYKEFGKTKLTLEQTLIYYNRRKKFWAVFTFYATHFGAHRLYWGDKFSKLFALFLFTNYILAYKIADITNFKDAIKYLNDWNTNQISIIILIFLIPLYIDLLLLIPITIKHNLQLKKDILDNKITQISKNNNPFFIQEILAFLCLIVMYIKEPNGIIPIIMFVALLDAIRIYQVRQIKNFERI